MSNSAYAICHQLRNNMDNYFSGYSYATKYDDITTFADVYSFIKGPLISDTLFVDSTGESALFDHKSPLHAAHVQATWQNFPMAYLLQLRIQLGTLLVILELGKSV